MELYFSYAPACKAASPLFTPFCDEYERSDLALDDDEWRQIEYLFGSPSLSLNSPLNYQRQRMPLPTMCLRSTTSSSSTLSNLLYSSDVKGSLGKKICYRLLKLHSRNLSTITPKQIISEVIFMQLELYLLLPISFGSFKPMNGKSNGLRGIDVAFKTTLYYIRHVLEVYRRLYRPSLRKGQGLASI